MRFFSGDLWNAARLVMHARSIMLPSGLVSVMIMHYVLPNMHGARAAVSHDRLILHILLVSLQFVQSEARLCVVTSL